MVLGLGMASIGAYASLPGASSVQAAVSAPVTAAPVTAQGRAVTQGFADVVAKVTPAVVTIRVESKAAPQLTQLPQFPEGSPFGDLFESFFGAANSGRKRSAPPRGQDIQVTLDLSFEEAVFGSSDEPSRREK